MHQRVANFLDHGFIQLGLFTFNHQCNVFAQLARNVVHHALKAVEGGANFDHAQLQSTVAHLFHQRGELGGTFFQLHHLGAVRNHVDVGTGNDQLAHQVDELVQLVGIDPDRAAFSDNRLFGMLLFLQRCFDHFGLHRTLRDQNAADQRSRHIGLLIQCKV